MSFDFEHAHRRREQIKNNIEKSYNGNLTPLTDEELEKSANEYFEKGGKRAVIGEKRTFGGREYVKTSQGWKFMGKGKGEKAKAHYDGTIKHHNDAGTEHPHEGKGAQKSNPTQNVSNALFERLTNLEDEGAHDKAESAIKDYLASKGIDKKHLENEPLMEDETFHSPSGKSMSKEGAQRYIKEVVVPYLDEMAAAMKEDGMGVKEEKTPESKQEKKTANKKAEKKTEAKSEDWKGVNVRDMSAKQLKAAAEHYGISTEGKKLKDVRADVLEKIVDKHMENAQKKKESDEKVKSNNDDWTQDDSIPYDEKIEIAHSRLEDAFVERLTNLEDEGAHDKAESAIKDYLKVAGIYPEHVEKESFMEGDIFSSPTGQPMSKKDAINFVNRNILSYLDEVIDDMMEEGKGKDPEQYQSITSERIKELTKGSKVKKLIEELKKEYENEVEEEGISSYKEWEEMNDTKDVHTDLQVDIIEDIKKVLERNKANNNEINSVIDHIRDNIVKDHMKKKLK